jgi:hypothetical protein
MRLSAEDKTKAGAWPAAVFSVARTFERGGV